MSALNARVLRGPLNCVVSQRFVLGDLSCPFAIVPACVRCVKVPGVLMLPLAPRVSHRGVYGTCGARAVNVALRARGKEARKMATGAYVSR